jgi:sec-independent protein translocase protein TatC
MPFLDHLEELRWRILKSLAAVAVAFVFTFWLCTASGFDVIAMVTHPVKPYLHGKKLTITGPIERFTLLLQAAGFLAFAIAGPVVGYQIGAFLVPALTKKERKALIPVLIGAAVLFLSGLAMAVFVFVPVTMGLMDKLPGGESLDQLYVASEYFSFLFHIALAFGAMFELPIVIVALTAIGLVTPQFLTKYRRHAVVATLIVCEIVTPGDLIISTLMLWIPVYGLYELSIIVSWFVYRGRLKREREEAAEAA